MLVDKEFTTLVILDTAGPNSVVNK